jgi:D-alanyl-D-alanine carboxypeptidase
VSAAVILADGSTWEGTAGPARTGEALQPHHQLVIASITKTVTSALVLQLAEEGRLGLDDSVGRWLGELRNVAPQITLRQLLNHTSGVANYTTHPAFAAALAADRSHVFTPRELLDRFVGTPDFAPGQGTLYSNTGFLLLGLVAEAASGQPIANEFRLRFWNPLGLEEVFLPIAEPARGIVANAWMSASGGLREVDPLANPAALSARGVAWGLIASAGNVARWGRALFAGDVLGAEMRLEMLQFVPAAGNIAPETGSGLGVRRYLYDGREIWGHSGGAPDGASLLAHDPLSGITIAVIANQDQGTLGLAHFLLAGRLLDRLLAGS